MEVNVVADPSVTDNEVQDVARLHAKYLSRGRAKLSNILGGQVEVQSSGARVFTSDGDVYVNCAGYGVLMLGATHEDVVEAVVAQIRRHPVGTKVFYDDISPRAAEALVKVCPPGLEKVHFCGGGAEAVETAIKLARFHGKRRLITATNGYHGRTMGALSVSAKSMYQDPFVPLLPDVVEIPFGDADALQKALADSPPSCFIVEPIQGEAGVIIPEDNYLPTVSRLCKEYDCFLVIDEILTGLGRLGKWWGVSDTDVEPEVILAGKVLSGGVVPIAAAICTTEAYAPFDKDPMLHTSTFAGSPIQAAAALSTIEAMQRHDIVASAHAVGERLLASLHAASQKAASGIVKEVRGRGIMLGIEFSEPRFSGEMMLNLLDQRILVNHSTNNSAVVRLTPPAVIADDDLDKLESGLENAFAAMGTLSGGRNAG
jgi:putrescine aminotransferase